MAPEAAQDLHLAARASEAGLHSLSLRGGGEEGLLAERLVPCGARLARPGQRLAAGPPHGCFQVDFDDGRKPLSIMSPVNPAQGPSLYWLAQSVCAQLNAYASRCPQSHSRGLDKLYLRTARSMLQQDACGTVSVGCREYCCWTVAG